ncbi:MAG TPA: hypothetical protein VIL16_33660 [Trebonia sp.]
MLGAAAALAADSGLRVLRATGSQFEANISYAACTSSCARASTTCPS